MSDQILPDIVGQIKEAYQQDIKMVQPMSNWASSLGHPCARYGVHRRVDWKNKKVHDVTTQFIFNGGKVIEQSIAKVYLERAGYQIIEADRPIQSESSGILKRLQIGGKLDFLCRKDGFTFPVEVKSSAHHVWESINTVEDFLFAKKSWLRTYPAQLALYLLAKEHEIGCFLLISKQTFAPKVIWMHQDYSYAEELLKRAEVINKHVADGTYPERIDYDEQLCGRCDFANICLENITRTEAEILTDDNLIEKLARREELKELVHEYNEIDDEVKTAIKGISKGIAGEFVITGKEVTRKGYQVPDKTFWMPTIRKVQ